MQKSLALVKSPRTFSGNDGGTVYVIDVVFEDEDEASIYGQSEAAVAQHKTLLDGLKGQPQEYELEFKRDYNGHKEYKIKNYPGMPARSGSKRRDGGNWETAEERAEWRASADARSALTLSVNLATAGSGTDTTEAILLRAREFVIGLKDMRELASFKTPPKPAPETPTPQTGVVSASSITPPSGNGQATGDSWEEIRNEALSVYGGDAGALMLAYEQTFGTRLAPSRMPAEHLLALIANPV
jgi:hypothetical protein